jgi:hypothetical protein
VMQQGVWRVPISIMWQALTDAGGLALQGSCGGAALGARCSALALVQTRIQACGSLTNAIWWSR